MEIISSAPYIEARSKHFFKVKSIPPLRLKEAQNKSNKISVQTGIFISSKYIPADKSAVAGIVTIQAVTMSPATLQRTFPSRSAEPTPIIEEFTTWVVLTGPPNKEAVKITSPDVN